MFTGLSLSSYHCQPRECVVVYDLQHFQDFLVHYDVIYKEVPYNVGLTRLGKLVALISSYEVGK